jgi:hypothetical protein
MSAVDVSHGGCGYASDVFNGEHDVRCGRPADRHAALGGRRTDAGALVVVEGLVQSRGDALRGSRYPQALAAGR